MKILGVNVEENPALALEKVAEFNCRVIARFEHLLGEGKEEEALTFLADTFGKYPEEE